jgi:hypothetical protein
MNNNIPVILPDGTHARPRRQGAEGAAADADSGITSASGRAMQVNI